MRCHKISSLSSAWSLNNSDNYMMEFRCIHVFTEDLLNIILKSRFFSCESSKRNRMTSVVTYTFIIMEGEESIRFTKAAQVRHCCPCFGYSFKSTCSTSLSPNVTRTLDFKKQHLLKLCWLLESRNSGMFVQTRKDVECISQWNSEFGRIQLKSYISVNGSL